MTREIKFRAFDKESKKMFIVNKLLMGAHGGSPFQVQGIIIDDEIKTMNICDEECDQNTPHCELMQYTGIKDSKDIEIYEGDIVEFEEPSFETQMITVPVTFERGAFCGNWDRGDRVDWIPLGDIEDIVVVGNVFENKDLLK